MARTMQRYISKELTHFAGKGMQPDAQYDTLIKILSEEWITHPPHNPSVSGNLVINRSAKISQNEMYLPQMVCFCDIPVEDLTLHVNKFSSFGLSFDKDFIAQQGGAPMQYVPNDSKVKSSLEITPELMEEYRKSEDSSLLYTYLNKSECFDSGVRKYNKLFDLLRKLIFEEVSTRSDNPKSILGDSVWDYPRDSDGYPKFDIPKCDQDLPQIRNDVMWLNRQLMELQRFLDFHLFSYLKFFDHTLSENHPDNYYFEREWRVVGNIKFNIENVRRVLIPSKYAKRLREDFPNYYGQITFLD